MMKSSIALLLLSMCSACYGQKEQPDQPGRILFMVDSAFVSVPVIVRSEDGSAVTDIPTTEFKLWDENIPQKLVAVKTEDLPISLVILMQTGGSASQYFRDYAEFPTLLSRLVGKSAHEVTLVTFDSKVEQIWHFPARSDGVKNALRHPDQGDSGAAIRDAVHFGVQQLQDEPGRFRRVILLLSDNIDEGSILSSRSLLEQLGSASTVVDSVVFAARTRKAKLANKREKLQSRCEDCTSTGSAIAALDANTASQISAMTGGSSTRFSDRLSFHAALLNVASQIQDGYTLGFQPNPATPGLHTLRVEMSPRHPKLQVVARSVYWMTSQSIETAP